MGVSSLPESAGSTQAPHSGSGLGVEGQREWMNRMEDRRGGNMGESFHRVGQARRNCKKGCCTGLAGMILNASGFPVLCWALMPYLCLHSLATYESRGTEKEWVIVITTPPYFLLQRRYYSWLYFPSLEKLYLTTEYPKACPSLYLKHLKWPKKKKKNPTFVMWSS